MEEQSQRRTVAVDGRTVTYTLSRKRVKNLNLRLTPDGSIRLSVPLRCSAAQADGFIREKWPWIWRHLDAKPASGPPAALPLQLCRERLSGALLRAYPLVEPLGVAFPVLKLRPLKSQWGNCHWARGYITLNTALAHCPDRLQDYVALHELVHFLHHDHGTGFYQTMTALMPDWQQRRRELKAHVTALL